MSGAWSPRSQADRRIDGDGPGRVANTLSDPSTATAGVTSLRSPDLCGVHQVAFSPDGARLAVTTRDRPSPAVHVWDLAPSASTSPLARNTDQPAIRERLGMCCNNRAWELLRQQVIDGSALDFAGSVERDVGEFPDSIRLYRSLQRRTSRFRDDRTRLCVGGWEARGDSTSLLRSTGSSTSRVWT